MAAAAKGLPPFSCRLKSVTISLNGEPHDLPGPVTIAALLEALRIDARRVAVELNLTVIKKAAYGETVVQAGDQVEIVNFVGGGDLGDWGEIGGI